MRSKALTTSAATSRAVPTAAAAVREVQVIELLKHLKDRGRIKAALQRAGRSTSCTYIVFHPQNGNARGRAATTGSYTNTIRPMRRK